ncbi:acyltransferase [Brucella sp. 2280]|uniref:acyltransferase family protein n=1 Tax=Brucella sp. 2280 TaxID=2592625 RepID=UPI001294CCB6|nr:acyltransferase [Brucella sp. 2280]QGA58253.1 acyltransferase family protein [Brucella sp. 2280]
MSYPTQPTNRMYSLDLLRFGAAMAVMFYHFLYSGVIEGFYWGLPVFNITAIGWMGVDVFFVISGLVIALTTEERSPNEFAKARFLRLFPALFICSLIGAILWVYLDKNPQQAFISWVASLTFFSTWFGIEPRLTLYWTLTVEATFYLWVFVFLSLGIWRKHLNAIMVIWLSIALVNEFSLRNFWLSKVLITPFAGHFCVGMALYQILRGQKSPIQILIMSLSWLCFYSYINGHFLYITNSFGAHQDANTAIIIPVIIVSLVYVCAIAQPSMIPAKACKTLGLASYPLYLIHVDAGFWPRAYADRVLFKEFPWLADVFTPAFMMVFSILLSIVLSIVIALYVEPKISRFVASLIGRKPKRALASS